MEKTSSVLRGENVLSGRVRIDQVNGEIYIANGGRLIIDKGGDILLSDNPIGDASQIKFARDGNPDAYWVMYKADQTKNDSFYLWPNGTYLSYPSLLLGGDNAYTDTGRTAAWSSLVGALGVYLGCPTATGNPAMDLTINALSESLRVRNQGTTIFFVDRNGLIPPSYTTVARDGLYGMMDGTMIYNVTTGKFNFWDAFEGAWQEVISMAV